MKTLTGFSVASLVIALSVGCGESTEPVVTVADLVGTWSATQFSVTDESGTIGPVNLINLGGSLVITVASNGNFTGTFRATALSAETAVAGSITIQQGTLTLAFTDGLDEPISGSFVLGNDRLTITGMGLTVDFEGQTIPSATVILVLERNG
ncbi:MAG: hypothetical protein OER90_14745 [Gemmatimonadota bacterium]|nr:hypothetical protein [Gemmatimonadota bacterium]